MRWLDGITDSMGDGEGQGSLACCSPWGHKESDTTEVFSINCVRLYFWGAPKSLQMVTTAMKLKDTYSLEEKL